VSSPQASGNFLIPDATFLAEIVAFLVILASQQGPRGAWVSYSAAVLWALVAVMIEQRSTSTITTAAAAVTAVTVLLAAFGPWETRNWSPQRSASTD